MKHPASLGSRLAASLGVLIFLLASSGGHVLTQTPAAKPAPVDREVHPGVDDARVSRSRGRDRRHPQPDAVGAHRRDGPHHDRERRADGARHRARKHAVRSARFSTGRDHQRHVQGRTATSTTVRCPATDWPAWRGASTSRTSRPCSPRVSPAEANGRPLNLDFETGTLEDWTATGDAFALVKEDSERQGPARGCGRAYWVSSGVGGSARRGTLSSAPYRVTHPYASFLVSGGAFASTRVELVLALKGQHGLLHHLGRGSGCVSAGGCRSEAVCRQGHLRSSGR